MRLHTILPTLTLVIACSAITHAATSDPNQCYGLEQGLVMYSPVDLVRDGYTTPIKYKKVWPAVTRRLVFGINGSDQLVVNTNGTVSIATTLFAKEIRVQANPFPDYVFADNYNLLPLAEVEVAIKRDKHLPGMPSAGDIAKDGLPVSDIVVKQMEKIEELTLHAIALKKENDALSDRLTRLEALVQAQAAKP